MQKQSKGEFVKRNAPEFCEVTIVFNGQKAIESEGSRDSNQRSVMIGSSGKEVSRHPERKFFECVCFSGNLN